jgi:integrase
VTIEGERESAYFDNEGEGWDWVHTKLADAKRGVRITGDNQRLADFLADWLEEEPATRVSANSLDSYRRSVGYVTPLIGRLRLRDIRRAHIERVFNELDRSLSRSTLNLAFRVLKQAFEYAVDNDYLPKNPIRRMKAPQLPGSKNRLVSLDEWHAIEDAFFGTRWWAWIWFLASTGMRGSEVLGLEWIHYDAATSTIRVERQSKRDYGRSGMYLGPVKSEASRRPVVLPAALAAILEFHREQQDRERSRAAAAGEWVGQGTIFCGPTGKLYFRSQPSEILRRVTTDLGIVGVTPHTFRHTIITDLQEEMGEQSYAVQALAGHASERTTNKIYSHATDKTRQRMADKIDTHLGGLTRDLPATWLTMNGDA